ncbi:MAG: SUMF1/EgtB/PvdO family nonheme iron enzyme [Planctomycetaceae bacterium]|nr:SUMF1/EgtB/PvdO family nonheme iron enzyme [Planctomycetaceae bacterium]
MRLMRELYGKQFENAKSSDLQTALARMLYDQALALHDDATGRYALLEESRNLSLNAGAVGAARQASELVNVLYEIDRTDWLAAGLDEKKIQAASAGLCKSLAADLLPWIDDAVEDNRWVAATKFVACAVVAARRSQDAETIRTTTERSRQFDKDRRQWEVVQEARKVLAERPADAAANSIVGKQLCFVEGKWNEGFAYLSRGDDENLKALAERSLAAPTDIDDVIALGDLWWERSERLNVVAQRRELQAGAAYWYGRVAHQLTGLLKTKIDRRLADAAAAGAAKSGGAVPAQFLNLPLSKEVSLALRIIPSGRFTMGSPSSEQGRTAEEVQHSVVISKPFCLALTEMTQAQYRAIMGPGEQAFSEDPQTPAHSISRTTIERCLQVMNSGPYASVLRFRLPTEAEWEYAARAGTTTPYYWGEQLTLLADNVNVSRTIDRVAQRRPNAWGLFDMSGNVAEFCHDGYHPQAYASKLVVDPLVPLTTTSPRTSVVRGGGFRDPTEKVRSASRGAESGLSSAIGFRVACDIVGRIPANWITREPPIAAPAAGFAKDDPSAPPAGATSTIETPFENTPEANRALGEWLLARKTGVYVAVGRKHLHIRPDTGTLPSEAFVIDSVDVHGSGPPLTDEDLRYLVRYSWITSFSLGGSINDAQLAILLRAPNMKSLAVLHASGVTDASLAMLSRAAKLSTLRLNHTSVQGIGISSLAALPQLEVLNLSGNPLSTQGLMGIASLASLKDLDLSRTQVGDGVLVQIGTLAKLERLCVDETAVTDAGLAYLSKLAELQTLSLNGCKISKIDGFIGCRKLSVLALSRTDVDARLSQSLPQLTELTILNLDDTNVGDSVIPALLRLENLAILNLRKTRISQGGLNTLRKERPKVSISH